MNAVESLALTGALPTACTHSDAARTVLSSVRIVRTTSTSFIKGTGLKKCSPSTCPARPVAAAIAVMLHDEVLDASSACGGQTLSSLANVSFLSAWFSVIASITRSQSLSASRLVAPLIRPSVSSFAGASILALATSASRFFLMLPRPLSSSAWLASTTVVGKPAWAETCAMPAPMRPHPMTPTVLIAIRFLDLLVQCFKHHGDALSAADAQSHEPVPFLTPSELVKHRQREARSRGRHRMAERDRTAVDVRLRAIQT